MLECLILGDSIAVGVSRRLPECEVIAEVGINSFDYYNVYVSQVGNANRYIISLGANDGYTNTAEAISKLRERLARHAKVVWLVPANNREAIEAVLDLSARYGDNTLRLTDFPLAGDEVHPTGTGYNILAEESMKLLD
jgi:lysophospholipase L1-like esterase